MELLCKHERREEVDFLPRLHPVLSPSPSDTTHVSDLDEPGWDSIITPSLDYVLRSECGYSEDQTRRHVLFFRENLMPWLGLPPRATITADGALTFSPRYASAMTNDFTPLEYSYSWKTADKAGVPVFRYIFDVAPPAGTGTRTDTLRAALAAIEHLANRPATGGDQLEVHIFPVLWKYVTQWFLDREPLIHPSEQDGGRCARCGISSTFVGCELASEGASLKLYWLLPSCQAPETTLGELDGLFDGAKSHSSLFADAGFWHLWSTLRDYVSSHSDILRIRMLSMDATQFPSSRVKVYTRCMFGDSVRFADAILPHLSLGGQVDIPSHFVDTAARVWDSVVGLATDGRRSRRRPRYCLLLHEVGISKSSGQVVIGAKLYIMCGEVADADSVLVEKLMRNCPRLKDSNLRSQFPSDGKPTGQIAEIGLVPRKDETEIGLYLNPCLFSDPTCTGGDDGSGGEVTVDRRRCDINA
ncbi:hypothetical protein ACRALDRAFT_1080298 [Sodiomyces alcalophilus JCM 7366]|uniref:uncharacterized protein n=1 Tax=Sodiomyces alcalophilus JCM 7366 TaxID=591952 RepID=UPI0039B640B1